MAIGNTKLMKLLLLCRWAYSQWQYNNNQKHLFNMAPLFLMTDFNLPKKASQEARTTSWGIKAHCRSSSNFKLSCESWKVLQTLLSRIEHIEKSRALRSGLLEGHSSLLMNTGMWDWIQLWGHVTERSLVEESKVHHRSSESLRVQGSSSVSKMYRWLFSFTPEGRKTSGDLPVDVIAAHTTTQSGFWRRLTLLPSTDQSLL